MTTFDARYLAKGWLSVAIAASTNTNQPALCRAVHIELFGDGVRLVATDQHVMLHSWVPALGKEDNPPPDFDEAPGATATAVDEDGRGSGLLKYLLGQASLAEKEHGDLVEVQLNLGIFEPEDEEGSFGFDAEWVTLEQLGRERLRLRVTDSPWPDWRDLLGRYRPRRAEAVALNPEIVGRLAKLGKLHGNRPLVWRWGGEDNMALVSIRDAEPAVEGAVMPVRIATGDDE